MGGAAVRGGGSLFCMLPTLGADARARQGGGCGDRPPPRSPPAQPPARRSPSAATAAAAVSRRGRGGLPPASLPRERSSYPPFRPSARPPARPPCPGLISVATMAATHASRSPLCPLVGDTVGVACARRGGGGRRSRRRGRRRHRRGLDPRLRYVAPAAAARRSTPSRPALRPLPSRPSQAPHSGGVPRVHALIADWRFRWFMAGAHFSTTCSHLPVYVSPP